MAFVSQGLGQKDFARLRQGFCSSGLVLWVFVGKICGFCCPLVRKNTILLTQKPKEEVPDLALPAKEGAFMVTKKGTSATESPCVEAPTPPGAPGSPWVSS